MEDTSSSAAASVGEELRVIEGCTFFEFKARARVCVRC